MAAKAIGTYVFTDSVVGFSNPTDVDTTARFTLGTVAKARDTGTTAYGDVELMYVKGGTNGAAKAVVTLDGAYGITLVAARGKGRVGVMLSALDSTSKYGWIVVKGKAAANSDTVADASACYIDGTAGRIDDAAVAGDLITGMYTASADDTNTCVVNMVGPAFAGDWDNA